MLSFLERLLDSSMFSPHGICLLWEPDLILLHVASDGVIAAAYFSIPAALSIFVSRRRDVDFGWIFWAFAIFITACGVTHVLSIVTLGAVHGIEGLVKVLTAVKIDRDRRDAMAPAEALALPCHRSFVRPVSLPRRSAAARGQSMLRHSQN